MSCGLLTRCRCKATGDSGCFATGSLVRVTSLIVPGGFGFDFVCYLWVAVVVCVVLFVVEQFVEG